MKYLIIVATLIFIPIIIAMWRLGMDAHKSLGINLWNESVRTKTPIKDIIKNFK